MINVCHGCYFGVLTRLNGILLSRKSVGIISHRVEHVESLLALVSCIDVAGDISEWMSHMQSSSRGIGEHVEYVELLALCVFSDLVGFVFHPLLVPLLFDFSKIVFHNLISFFLFFSA